MTATLDFVACHNMTYVRKYNLTKGLKAGGLFLLNTSWNLEQLSKNLPNEMKKFIAENQIRFYTIDAMKIAHETGMERRINTIMQVAFFKLAHVMPFDEAYEILKKMLKNMQRNHQPLLNKI